MPATRLLDQVDMAGTVTYDYDARGNQIKITNGSNITNYTYNAADQLTGVSAPGINATYAYDADGRRVKQTLGSTVTNFLWDEASAYGDVVYEYNGSGAMLASYVLGGTELISQTRGSTTSYFLQDGQNSTRALTSSTGTVTDTYSYTAFGELFSSTGTTTNSYLYTGQQLDTSTGLYSLRARYYNPALGRFLSQDTYPVNFGNPVELNRYVYVANSPINLADPSGNQALIDFAIRLTTSRVAMGALIGAGTGAATALLCGGNALDVAKGALTGAAFGAAFASGMVPAGVGVTLGAAGLGAGYADFIAHDYHFTPCNVIVGLTSLAAIGGD